MLPPLESVETAYRLPEVAAPWETAHLPFHFDSGQLVPTFSITHPSHRIQDLLIVGRKDYAHYRQC